MKPCMCIPLMHIPSSTLYIEMTSSLYEEQIVQTLMEFIEQLKILAQSTLDLHI